MYRNYHRCNNLTDLAKAAKFKKILKTRNQTKKTYLANLKIETNFTSQRQKKLNGRKMSQKKHLKFKKKNKKVLVKKNLVK